jgi:hypothetical protein
MTTPGGGRKGQVEAVVVGVDANAPARLTRSRRNT